VGVVVGGVAAQSMVPTKGKLWTSPPLEPATPWWCSAMTTAPSMFAELRSISTVEGAYRVPSRESPPSIVSVGTPVMFQNV